MRKNLLPLLLLLGFYACKPEGSTELPRVQPNDPKGVSSTIRVWHGLRTQGNPPAVSNNPSAPKLDPQSNNQSTTAIAGHYAIIQPQIESGDVAGYYVKVVGASDYFKVDYSKPREIAGRIMLPLRNSRHNHSLSRGMGIDSTGTGTLDSSIVITIPATIQPGQFCITYWAYDNSGLVSNPITTCITVTSFGTDATSAYLNATWHITGTSEDTTLGWEPVYGAGDTAYNVGSCVNGHIVDSTGAGPLVTYPLYLYTVSKADLSFANNGGMKYEYAELDKEFNYAASSCSNFVFISESDSDHITGAWSYTPATHKMVLIFEFDDTGVPDPEAYEYDLHKISNNKVYLYDPGEDQWLRLEK